jgi:hypothetical protein
MYDKPLNFEDQRSEAEELEIPIHLTLTSETPLQFSLKRSREILRRAQRSVFDKAGKCPR